MWNSSLDLERNSASEKALGVQTPLPFSSSPYKLLLMRGNSIVVKKTLNENHRVQTSVYNKRK